SYSADRRQELCKRADTALIDKHGTNLVSQGVAQCRHDRVLEGIRARFKVLEDRRRYLAEGRERWEGKRVLFILPAASCGGGTNIVMHEAEAMRRMGVDARLLNLKRQQRGFETSYPENGVPVIYAQSEHEIPALIEDYDGVMATLYVSVGWMEGVAERSKTAIGYYIQDFEPLFFPTGSKESRAPVAPYTPYPDLLSTPKP